MQDWTKICHLESLRQACFQIFNDCEFESDDLEIVYVDSNIYFLSVEK